MNSITELSAFIACNGAIIHKKNTPTVIDANLGEEFGKWLEEMDAFSTDQLGNPRDKNAMWPGAYQE